MSSESDLRVVTRDGDVVTQMIRDERVDAEIVCTPEQAITIGGQLMITALRAARERCEAEMAEAKKSLDMPRFMQ